MTQHRIVSANAEKIFSWIRTRGGIAVWSPINLSNPGVSWTTPARTESGEPMPKPTWQAADQPSQIITDPTEVIVDVPEEVRRFHVAVRRGSQGFTLKLTDASTRKVRAAVDKVGEHAWYEFNYLTQEAVIYRPGRSCRLTEYFSG